MSRVLQFSAENVKRVEVLDITPSGDLVELAGKNKSGKTSALQCLSVAIEGARHIQKVPIREGAETGQITLTLGTKGKNGEPDTVEMTVHREFSRREPTKSDAKPFATKLTLTLADGQEPRKAQDILNGLYNSICTDPLAFTRMKPDEQYNTLRAMVPGFNFEVYENKRRAAFTKRTDVNRDAERVKASASLISVPTGTPDALVDEKAITDAMAAAGQTNGEIEGRKIRRENAATTIADTKATAAKFRTDAANLIKEAERLEAEAIDLQKKLDDAPKLPELVDTAQLQIALGLAQAANTNVTAKLRKAKLLEEAAGYEQEANLLTLQIDQLDAAKTDAIKAAKLPVEGLTLGEGEILLNGLPFDQASFREQLVTSCAIAMSSNPKIRIMQIADGNALDDDGWDVLRKIAADNDFQVWVESVKPQTDTAIILENGKEKGK